MAATKLVKSKAVTSSTPDGWREIVGLKATRDNAVIEYRKAGTSTGVACCFVGGKPLCGRRVTPETWHASQRWTQHRPLVAAVYRNRKKKGDSVFGVGIAACVECDRLNDGMWYLDAI